MAVSRLVSSPATTAPIMAKFDTTSTIGFEPGDLVRLSSGLVTAQGTSTVTSGFLGVCAQKRPSGSTTGTALRLFGNSNDGEIRVDTAGEFEFDCSTTVAMTAGDFLGPDGTTANTLAEVGAASISIGVLTHNTAATGSGVVQRVRCRIHSRMVPLAVNT